MGDLLRRALAKRPHGEGERPRRGGVIALWVVLALMLVWAVLHLRDIGGMFAAFGEYLQYKFIRRALAVGALVSLCASLLGVTLVLKRYSMIGDGLSTWALAR